jgi:hypothetical protein
MPIVTQHNKKDMRTLLSTLGIILILSSCGKRQPKIAYNNQNRADSLTMDSIVSDTSKILIAELPVYFDSTDFLIHPIELVSLNDWDSKRKLKIGSYSDRDYSNSGFSVDSYRKDYFSGNITNLVFENLKNRNQHLLTDKVLNITYVQYLRDLSKKINRHYILYSVIDKDLNHDGKLDYQDINSLYISKLDGTDFIKITNNFHEYNGGKLIIQDLKYYFRTIEDTNKDGLFNKVDKYHYYYIDFSNDPYKIIEYNPLKLIMK